MSEQQRFQYDFEWSMKHMPKCKQLIAKYFNIPIEKVTIASDYEDKNEATDLWVELSESNKIRLSTRFRRYIFFNFNNDILITTETKFGSSKTELRKLTESNLVKYYFYGFINQEDTDFIWANLMDLDIFRDNVQTLLKNNQFKVIIPKEGNTKSYAFNYYDFPENLIIKKWRLQCECGWWTLV
jgi:hypothetical protein